MQLHPAEQEYINQHPYCLHLWRPQTDAEITDTRQHWEAEGEEWPYGDVRSPGAIPIPPRETV